MFDSPDGVGPGPLHGLRVIDASTILAGPLACQIMGDFGAEVIKVEHPEMPDGLRGHGPSVDDTALWWKEVGRNKSTMSVDLGTAEGAEILLSLVRVSDVLVENFRPGTLERWGLGWPELQEANPDLVLLRVTGFGQEGPYATRRAFGTLAEAMSGFAHLTGSADRPPSLPPFGLADTMAGFVGASAVAMALYHRDRKDASGPEGRGQVIDLSILEAMLSVVGPGPMAYDKLGVVETRSGNRSPNNSPRNLYETKDGAWVAVSASAHNIAARVMTLVGRPEIVDEPWFATGRGRVAHVEEVDGPVAEWIAQRTRAEVTQAFEEVGAAIAPVYDISDIVADPQVQAREMLLRVPDDDLGDVLMHNVLVRMSRTPGSIRFTGREHGADTDRILTDTLGYTPEQVAAFRASEVVA